MAADFKSGGVAGRAAFFMQEQERAQPLPKSAGPGPIKATIPPPINNNTQQQQPPQQPQQPPAHQPTIPPPVTNSPQQRVSAAASQHSRPTRGLPTPPPQTAGGAPTSNPPSTPPPHPITPTTNGTAEHTNNTAPAISPRKTKPASEPSTPTSNPPSAGAGGPPPVPAFRRPDGQAPGSPQMNGHSGGGSPTPGTPPPRSIRRSVGAVTQNLNPKDRPLPSPTPKPGQDKSASAPAGAAGSPKPGGLNGTTSVGPGVLKTRPVTSAPKAPTSPLPPRPVTMNFGNNDSNSLGAPPQVPLPGPPKQALPPVPEEGTLVASDFEEPKKPAVDSAKMARMRAQVVKELVVTERTYIKDLEVVIKIFLFPLQAMSFLPEQTVTTIFANVEIILNLNKEFLKSLEDRLKEYPPDDSSMPLGDLFQKMGDYFKMYTTYCANHPIAVSTAAKLEETNSEFQNYLRICHTDKEAEGHRIYDYLIKPVQRLCKYPLLLRELLRNTEESHPDYHVLVEAQKKIDEVVDYINERKRNAEGNQQVFEIQMQTEGSHLVSPTRHLKKEGVLNSHDPKNLDKAPVKMIVFLFNDLLVLVKPKNQKYFEKEKRVKGCFNLKARVPLGTTKLISMSLEKAKIDNCFQIQYVPDKEDGESGSGPVQFLTLSAESQADQMQWIKDIKAMIKEFQKRKYQDTVRAQNPGLRDSLSLPAGSMITITRSSSSTSIPIPRSTSTSGPVLTRISSEGSVGSGVEDPLSPRSAGASPSSSPLASSSSGWGVSPSVRRKAHIARGLGSRGSEIKGRPT